MRPEAQVLGSAGLGSKRFAACNDQLLISGKTRRSVPEATEMAETACSPTFSASSAEAGWALGASRHPESHKASQNKGCSLKP